MRNYHALFLRRNVSGGIPHSAYFTEIYSVAQKTWWQCCTGVLYYFAQCPFHAAILSSMQTAVILMLVMNLGNSDRTVTWWKYYFYPTHIPNSAFCPLKFLDILQLLRPEKKLTREKYLLSKYNNTQFLFSKRNVFI